MSGVASSKRGYLTGDRVTRPEIDSRERERETVIGANDPTRKVQYVYLKLIPFCSRSSA